MHGVLLAAQRAGWETLHIVQESDVPTIKATTEVPTEAAVEAATEGDARRMAWADAVVLPWPRSFRDGELVAGPGAAPMTRRRVLALLPPCRALLAGGVGREEAPQAGLLVCPERDEAFLRKNARLTAEGALLEVLRRRKRALLAGTALVTGFGRIGQEMTARLCAMGMFVIVCARSEAQMRMAHGMGAHPVPLAQIAPACAQADVIINTVPARVLGEEALLRIGKRTPVIELASAPYGLDLERAVQMGLEVFVEAGLPGRYAPLDAGEALFDVLLRAMGAAGSGMERKCEQAEAQRQEDARREDALRQGGACGELHGEEYREGGGQREAGGEGHG